VATVTRSESTQAPPIRPITVKHSYGDYYEYEDGSGSGAKSKSSSRPPKKTGSEAGPGGIKALLQDIQEGIGLAAFVLPTPEEMRVKYGFTPSPPGFGPAPSATLTPFSPPVDFSFDQHAQQQQSPFRNVPKPVVATQTQVPLSSGTAVTTPPPPSSVQNILENLGLCHPRIL
jgi:hypothetical protein